MSHTPAPPWYFDPTDEDRYAVATDGKCPACGASLSPDKSSAFATSAAIASCSECRRCFYAQDGRRVSRTWYSGPGYEVPNQDELRFLLVSMLRAARPHPVEHPTMWRVWGDVCARLRLNPDDFRVPTARDQ